MARRNLFSAFAKMKVDKMPSDRSELPIVDKDQEIVSQMSASDSPISSISQLNEFRMLAEDRETQYNSYDEMSTDSVIAAALEIYADDATAYDEQGRVIWVESDDENIAKAGNRLLEILDIPERAWKHIYQACKYGDYYLKLYRKGDLEEDDVISQVTSNHNVHIVNDKSPEFENRIPPYIEYVEDVSDPATVFDLCKRGKTAGFIQIKRDMRDNNVYAQSNITRTYSLRDVDVYRADRMVHIMIGENMSRDPEYVNLRIDEENSSTYDVSRGKSILYDVYPIQKELQLLEDSLLLNRLTRSSLIRLLEIEVGDMPKKEANAFVRRIKNLVEQHIALDTSNGFYKSYNQPGPIDNVVYIPVKNGKGHIDINNLGGDVNIRDIADVDYFNNKRAGALKIPRPYLGDDLGDTGLSNGGSLTQMSLRYARTIKRIQTAYIRAITTLLNLFFIDKKLDYVNRFKVRMTSPSTQEDLDRANLISTNVGLVSSIMSLMESLEGDTQKKILNHLVANVMKMPEVATIIEDDTTPSEDIAVDGEMSDIDTGGPDIDIDLGSSGGGSSDLSTEFSGGTESGESSGEGFTDEEYSSFEDF